VRPVLTRLIRRVRDESGFTLAELLSASVLGLIVIGAATLIFMVGVRDQPRLTARDAQIQQARFTMEQIVRELRQGSTVYTATSSQLAFLTYVKSATCGGAKATTAIPCRVTYTCTSGTCTRTERNPDGSGTSTATTVVTGLSSSSVFTYSPSSTAPTYVNATMTFPTPTGASAITIDDGAALRNPIS
jgi:Tfp pilus assembly protein PilW